MVTRELPPDEWSKLDGTDLALLRPFLESLQTHLLVVEDENGRIVGGWPITHCLHADGIWIAPSHRKQGDVARRLLTAMRDTARQENGKVVWASALTEEDADLIRRIGGYQIVGTHFVVPMEKG